MSEEFQSANEELECSNKAITNPFGNMDICTVILDCAMRVKLCTPPAARLFNLRASDGGRPLSDFSANFSDSQLLADTQAVLERCVPLQREVRTNDGRHFLCHMQTYPTQDKPIDGVVITFVDITTRMRAEHQLRANEAKLKELNRVLEERVSERTAELSRRESELRTLAANVPAMFSYVDANEVYRYVGFFAQTAIFLH